MFLFLCTFYKSVLSLLLLHVLVESTRTWQDMPIRCYVILFFLSSTSIFPVICLEQTRSDNNWILVMYMRTGTVFSTSGWTWDRHMRVFHSRVPSGHGFGHGRVATYTFIIARPYIFPTAHHSLHTARTANVYTWEKNPIHDSSRRCTRCPVASATSHPQHVLKMHMPWNVRFHLTRVA
jgi:hypothetical protein